MAASPVLWLASLLLLAWSSQAQDVDVKSIPMRTHTWNSPYLDFPFQSRWWDFGGSTVIRTDQYIRLTQTQPSQAGWIFSRVPITATNWEIEVEFKIHGTGSLHGDGMAMWLTKERAEQGPVFGMKDRFEGLGIFFDTYKNNRPGVVFPYVMAMLGDGQTTYDQANDGKANELAGCSARGVRNQDFPTKAKLKFFQDKNLTLDLVFKNEDEWTRCFELPGVKIPSVAYLGFSAETGELSDNHDILRVATNNIYITTKNAGASSNAQSGKSWAKQKASYGQAKESGGWFWFFMKFLMFGLALAGAYVGFTIYRTRRRDRF